MILLHTTIIIINYIKSIYKRCFIEPNIDEGKEFYFKSYTSESGEGNDVTVFWLMA